MATKSRSALPVSGTSMSFIILSFAALRPRDAAVSAAGDDGCAMPGIGRTACWAFIGRGRNKEAIAAARSIERAGMVALPRVVASSRLWAVEAGSGIEPLYEDLQSSA